MKKIVIFILTLITIWQLIVLKVNMDLTEERLREEIQRLEEKKEYLLDERDKLYQDLIEKDQRIKELEEIKIFAMEATAYTDDEVCQGKWVGQTATGMKPQVGVVAVDPRIIPLGSRLYVEGYGKAIAGDTGGAIKGNRIDLFMATRGQALKFGRKKLRVRLIE